MTLVCPPSELGFSQVREDVAAERAALARAAADGPVRMLLVASGGCSALALLADPRVGRIDAVDANPAQLHLTTLRGVAATTLNRAGQVALLGLNPMAAPDPKLYDALRVRLPAATRAYWDERPEQRAYGLQRVGRFEQLFRELAAALAGGPDPIDAPAAAVAHPGWGPAFAQTFSRERLVAAFGEAAVAQSTRVSFAEHFAAVVADAVGRKGAVENPFLFQVLRDGYPYGIWPAYMHPAIQTALRTRGLVDLATHEGTLQDLLPTMTGPYGLIQTSNVGDWMPIGTFRQLLADAAARLAPGGALIARRLNGDYDLAAEVDAHVPVDRRLSLAVTRTDRSFFYREVVVAFKPKADG